MIDNINLAINGSTECWVAKFLDAMVVIGAVSHEDLNACKHVNDYVTL